MAFNLNKSDGSERSVNQKFNLSKTNEPIVVETNPVKAQKSKAVMYALIVLLLASASWYLFFNKSDSKPSNVSLATNEQASAEVVQTAAAVDQKDTVKANTQSVEKVTTSKDLGTMPLKNKIPVSFASGVTTFDTLDQSIEADILSALSANPESTLEVRGYASSEGTLAVNQAISQARADAFKNYLVSRKISPDRITAIGKGIENPIASNQTATGRRKNRRVEIDIR